MRRRKVGCHLSFGESLGWDLRDEEGSFQEGRKTRWARRGDASRLLRG